MADSAHSLRQTTAIRTRPRAMCRPPEARVHPLRCRMEIVEGSGHLLRRATAIRDRGTRNVRTLRHLRQTGHPCRLRAMAGHTVGRTDLSTRPRVARRRLAAATVEAIGTGLRRTQVNRAAQFLREVATEADRRPIVRRSICGSRSCNRVLRADILAALARHQVTVAEAEAATLRRATAAVVDTQHHLAAEAITARLVTVAAEVAASDMMMLHQFKWGRGRPWGMLCKHPSLKILALRSPIRNTKTVS